MKKDWNTREKRREAERNTNQLAELLKILNHFFPDLRIQLLNVKDPKKEKSHNIRNRCNIVRKNTSIHILSVEYE